jgi:hypothetical protein
MDLGVIASAGECGKILDVSQCNKCFKYGHYRVKCKLRFKIGNCKFCAATDSNHESADCPDARIPEHHRCCNCKDKKGFKTHNAGEKTNFFFMKRK